MLAEIVWDKGTLTILMVFAIPIVAIVCGTWYKFERMRSADALKRKLVERGMSAEEIERVVKAGEPVDE
jgi:hypothetical protein